MPFRGETNQMIVTDLEDLTGREVLLGFRAKFVHSENVTVSYWTVKAGAALPEHAHPHEQITNMLEGTFEMIVDGEPQTLKANMVAVIPSNVSHSGTALTDCKIIDVFYPVREDYRDPTY
jgi:quercetin dioxygenase-like cupin family protein